MPRHALPRITVLLLLGGCERLGEPDGTTPDDGSVHDGIAAFAGFSHALLQLGDEVIVLDDASGGAVTEAGTTPLRLEVPLGEVAGEDLFDLVNATARARAAGDAPPTAATATVVLLDDAYEESGRLELTGLGISEVTLPAAEAAVSEDRPIILGLVPNASRPDTSQVGSNQSLTVGANETLVVGASEDAASKKWLCSNFRFEVGDLPSPDVIVIDPVRVLGDERGRVQVRFHWERAQAAWSRWPAGGGDERLVIEMFAEDRSPLGRLEADVSPVAVTLSDEDGDGIDEVATVEMEASGDIVLKGKKILQN